MEPKEIVEAIDKSKAAFEKLEPLLKHSENWNLGQKLAAAFVCLGSATLLVIGVARPNVVVALVLGLTGIAFLTLKRRVVEAQVFAVKGANGKYRAALSAEGANSSLILFGARLDPRVSLTANADGSSIIGVWGMDGKPRLVLVQPSDSRPVLEFRDTGGMPLLHVDELGLTALDKSGTPRIMLANSDTPMLALNGPDGRVRVGLAATDRTFGLTLVTEDSAASVDLKIFDHSTPALLLKGKGGHQAVIQSPENANVGSIRLTDTAGKVAWSAL